MEYKVKLLLAIFAFGTFSCGLLNLMVNRRNGFNTSDRKILLPIFGERNSEMGFIESCPTDITGSSRPFGFFKWLFSWDTWDTCKSIRNNKSPWFLERFNASIQLEWPLSQPLSQEEFRWWNTRQSSGMSYKKLQTVLMQIQKLMPNKTQLFFKEKKEGQCVTCAVVGNSQNVIGSGLGKFIDCHDYVFRMNRAPVKGYEKDVGSVTTHRFNYPGSMIHIPPATGLVFLSYLAEDMGWLSNVLNITKSRANQLTSLDRDKLIIFNPLFMHYIQRSWLEGKCRYPSTGIITAIFALHVCNKVDLFGFGMNIHKQWPHYFDKNYKGTTWENHNASIETIVLERLKNEGIIRMFKGNDNT